MIRRVLLGVVAGVLLAACGGDDGESIGERPAKVDASLVPGAISNGLELYESTSEETVGVFANAGERTVVVDGRLWEIRKGARLVGALQISTVKAAVDLGSPAHRDPIIDEVLVGSVDRIRVGDVEVYTSAANDKVVYVWFGESMFEVLQLKGDELDHEQVLHDVIEHQDGLPAWRPLPSDVEAEVDDDEETEE